MENKSEIEEFKVEEEGVAYVTPILPHEEEIWKGVCIELEKKDLLDKVEAFPEQLKVRFIRGSEFVKKRDKMVKRIVDYLEETLKYREKYEVESILLSHMPNLEDLRESLWPAKYYGKTSDFDEKNLDKREVGLAKQMNKDYSYKKDRVIILIDLLDADFKRAKVFSEETLTAHVAFSMELLELKIKNGWLGSSRLVLIYDLSKLTMSTYYSWYKAGAAKLLGVLGGNYPESVDKIYVLNPPFVFSMIFKMVKPLMEPDTVLKINLVKGNKEIEKAMVAEGMDIGKLPQKYFPNGTDIEPLDVILDDEIIAFAKDDRTDKTIEELLDLVRRVRE